MYNTTIPPKRGIDLTENMSTLLLGSTSDTDVMHT